MGLQLQSWKGYTFFMNLLVNWSESEFKIHSNRNCEGCGIGV